MLKILQRSIKYSPQTDTNTEQERKVCPSLQKPTIVHRSWFEINQSPQSTGIRSVVMVEAIH